LLNYTLEGWAQSDLVNTKYEIIIVNDGAKEFAFYPPQDLNVKVIHCPRSKGAGYARNLGASRAENSYVFFCDADHVVPPDVISTHEEIHCRKNGRAVVVGAVFGRRTLGFVNLRQLHPDLLRRIFNFARFDTALLDKLVAAALSSLPIEVVSVRRPDLYRALCRFSFCDHFLSGWGRVLLSCGNDLADFPHAWLKVAAGSFSMLRDSFMNANGFDETMKSMEDWEFGARLIKNCFPIICSPSAEPLHLVHPRDKHREGNNIKSVLQLRSKHPDLISALLEDPQAQNLPGRELVEGLLSSTKTGGQNGTCIRIQPMAPQQSSYVCLTFDDGPEQPGTSAILKVLQKYSARATFFALGEKVRTHANLCRKMISEGHEIGLHGWSHYSMNFMSLRDIRRSLMSCMQAVKEVTGRTARWARPPYGALCEKYSVAARELGLTTVLWDISPRDWSCPTRFELLTELLTTDLRGQIVLLHDGSGDPIVTAECLDYLIPRLQNNGIQIIKLSDAPFRQ
jgi:peptidoglycan/xylan/chitin deacetylase (PgdA/CDA1 family)/glycosyltransferase involved in cell wall biosynthesis